MMDNILAISMIAMLIGAGLLITFTGSRPSSQLYVSGFLLTAISFAWLNDLTKPHFAKGYYIDVPSLLSAILAGLVFAAVPSKKIKFTAIITIILCGLTLTIWVESIICDSQSSYVCNSSFSTDSKRQEEGFLPGFQKILLRKAAMLGEFKLPKGWIENSWLQATGEKLYYNTTLTIEISRPFWHSWFTRLYYLEEIEKGIWCPGGQAIECIPKMVLSNRSIENMRSKE